MRKILIPLYFWEECYCVNSIQCRELSLIQRDCYIEYGCGKYFGDEISFSLLGAFAKRVYHKNEHRADHDMRNSLVHGCHLKYPGVEVKQTQAYGQVTSDEIGY